MSQSSVERVHGFRNTDMQQHVGRKSSKLDEKCRRSPDTYGRRDIWSRFLSSSVWRSDHLINQMQSLTFICKPSIQHVHCHNRLPLAEQPRREQAQWFRRMISIFAGDAVPYEAEIRQAADGNGQLLATAGERKSHLIQFMAARKNWTRSFAAVRRDG